MYSLPSGESRDVWLTLMGMQAQKFGAAADESDDELEEESLLETPLDKVEPYGLFKETLLSKLSFSSPWSLLASTS